MSGEYFINPTERLEMYCRELNALERKRGTIVMEG